jgi:hypothetical protein
MSFLATESSVHGWSIEHLDEKTIAGPVRRIDARFPVCLRGNHARECSIVFASRQQGPCDPSHGSGLSHRYAASRGETLLVLVCWPGDAVGDAFWGIIKMLACLFV